MAIILFLVYSRHLNSVNAQSISWKKYSDPGQKFSFLYPASWLIKSMHDNITGTTNVILENPNSSRAQVSILYNPNEALLISKTGKEVLPSRALTNMEKEIGDDFIFFNSTGKFPHKYSIQKYQSASDVVDYEKSEGKPGKMLIVFTKVNDKDSFVITYSDSKRLFTKICLMYHRS
ncbi:MAG: PsbP-related protein [Nitrososphaerota archaeon]